MIKEMGVYSTMLDLEDEYFYGPATGVIKIEHAAKEFEVCVSPKVIHDIFDNVDKIERGEQ